MVVAACIPQVSSVFIAKCIHVSVYIFGNICECVCLVVWCVFSLVPLQVSKIKDNGMLERVRPRSSGLSHSESASICAMDTMP